VDAEGAISGAGSLINSRIYNMLRQERNCSPAFPTKQKAGRQRCARVSETFHENVISSWDIRKKQESPAGASKRL